MKTKYTKSKAVRPGDIVILHGKKFIRCGRSRRKPIGIWREYSEQVFCTLNGEIIKVEIPESVQFYGSFTVQVALEKVIK